MVAAPQLRLGTRGSPLALAQAREARARIAAAAGWPEGAVAIAPMKTTGDLIQDRALAEAGGKGLFTKELDRALLDGVIDAAIHSAKDLPTQLPDGIVIAGCLPREDVRDALIARVPGGLAAIPAGGVIGTASLRRQAQVLRCRPDLHVRLLRGNVETRLRRVENGDFDATLLAMAGLNRLGLAQHAGVPLDTEAFLPAVGQGAIAIAMRRDDAVTGLRLAPVIDGATTTALLCERAFLAVLDGSCRTPIAGYASLGGEALLFRGTVLSPDGSEAVDVALSGSPSDAEALGAAAGNEILARGSHRLLAPFGPA